MDNNQIAATANYTKFVIEKKIKLDALQSM